MATRTYMQYIHASSAILPHLTQNAVHSKQDEFDGGEFDLQISKGSKRDGGADPEVMAPDLLAACKANDEGWAQDLLSDGVSPGYSDPESGMC